MLYTYLLSWTRTAGTTVLETMIDRMTFALLLTVLAWAVACSGESESETSAPAQATTAPADGVSVLQLDTSGRGVSVTHRPSGLTHALFADETFADSEEGTFHRLLSHFGPYVSYRTDWYFEGGGHPSFGTTYNAVKVGKTVEVADLRDLFSEEAIYSAILQTDIVQRTSLEHSNLSELIDGLARTYECEMSFEHFFSSFFVRAVTDNAAEVVVGLTHGCEAQRGNFATLILKMDVREDLKNIFTDLNTFAQ